MISSCVCYTDVDLVINPSFKCIVYFIYEIFDEKILQSGEHILGHPFIFYIGRFEESSIFQ